MFLSSDWRRQLVLAAVVAIIAAAVVTPSTMAFVPTTSTTITTRSPLLHTTTTTALLAKKVKRKPSNTPASGSGGGFGKATDSAAASVISFSGHSGSGTKALRKVANQFDAIRKAHDVTIACRDVYVRSPLNSPTTFWFVGKIASVPSSSNDQDDDDDKEAVESPRWIQTALLLKRIILEYAKDQLRPQNLGGKYAAQLELWLAPGDSEMDTATNKVTLKPVKGSLTDTEITLQASDIGYNPEIYVGDERVKGGLRVERDENGVPTKASYDVNFSE